MDASSRNTAATLTNPSAEEGENRAFSEKRLPNEALPNGISSQQTSREDGFPESWGPYGRLFSEGHRFSFFQAVRLAEHLFPAAPPVGETTRFADERLRLRPSRGQVFPAADVRRVEYLEAGSDRLTKAAHVRLTATFLGLYGVDAPLPSTLTEPAAFAGENGAPSALRHFLDVFNHRFYAFFYRSWKKHRPLLHALRLGRHRPAPSGTEKQDAHARRFLALAGLGVPGTLDKPLAQTLLPEQAPRQQSHPSTPGGAPVPANIASSGEEGGERPPSPSLPPMRLAAFAGLLAQRTRSAEGLRVLLSGFFEGLPVRVVENVPRWIPIQERPSMGSGGAGETARLGVNTSIGERVYDCATKFRIELGPMDLDTFRSLMPGQRRARQLQALVRLYAPDRLAFDVKLSLDPEAAPHAQLGGGGTKLGHSAVLGRSASKRPERIFAYDA